jgi:hypothetical protein
MRPPHLCRSSFAVNPSTRWTSLYCGGSKRSGHPRNRERHGRMRFQSLRARRETHAPPVEGAADKLPLRRAPCVLPSSPAPWSSPWSDSANSAFARGAAREPVCRVTHKLSLIRLSHWRAVAPGPLTCHRRTHRVSLAVFLRDSHRPCLLVMMKCLKARYDC